MKFLNRNEQKHTLLERLKEKLESELWNDGLERKVSISTYQTKESPLPVLLIKVGRNSNHIFMENLVEVYDTPDFMEILEQLELEPSLIEQLDLKVDF